MRVGQAEDRAYVVYRGTGRGNRPVEVHLVAAPAIATAADAWTRLTRLDPSVDPRSIEIETRRLRRSEPARARGPKGSTPPIDLARWLARRAAMAHDARS
jgi:hypothetical protein